MELRRPLIHSSLLLSILSACGEAPRDVLVSAQAHPDEATPMPRDRTAQAPLIVFLGDSLTAGSGLGQGDAFPALIQARLEREGRRVRIVNAGVSGDTSAGGLARMDWMLQQDPDVVVVALGANDGLRGQPTEALERNLRAIVAKARDHGARVLLVGMRMPPSLGEEYTREFAAVYPRVAKDSEVELVPFLLEGVGGRAELNQADGLHPNEAGQRRMADTVYDALEKLLPAE